MVEVLATKHADASEEGRNLVSQHLSLQVQHALMYAYTTWHRILKRCEVVLDANCVSLTNKNRKIHYKDSCILRIAFPNAFFFQHEIQKWRKAGIRRGLPIVFFLCLGLAHHYQNSSLMLYSNLTFSSVCFS